MIFDKANKPMTEAQKSRFDKIKREQGETYAWFYKMTLIHGGEKYHLRVNADYYGSLDLYLWRSYDKDRDRYIYFCHDYEERDMAEKHFQEVYGLKTYMPALFNPHSSTEGMLWGPVFTHDGVYTDEELEERKKEIIRERVRKRQEEEERKKNSGLFNWFKRKFKKKEISWERGEQPPIL